MRFNFCLANFFRPNFSPSDRLTLSSVMGDGARFLGCALEEAGHTVLFSSDAVYKDAINIFWERFYYFENGVDMPAQLHAGGYKFGLICTEPLNVEGAYNPFEFEPNSARIIYEQFAHTAKLAEFVWYLLDEAGPACRALNPNSHFLPVGHIASYAQLGDPAARPSPATDFLLQGVITPRRQEIVDVLTKAGYRVTAGGFQPDYIRLSQMESARVALSPQKSANHSIFSYMRIYHAIMNRVPMIVEYDGPPNYLSPYCITARPEYFLQTCQAMARRKDLAALAQSGYDRLAREMPMRPVMENLLQKSFSAADLQRA